MLALADRITAVFGGIGADRRGLVMALWLDRAVKRTRFAVPVEVCTTTGEYAPVGSGMDGLPKEAMTGEPQKVTDRYPDVCGDPQ